MLLPETGIFSEDKSVAGLFLTDNLINLMTYGKSTDCHR